MGKIARKRPAALLGVALAASAFAGCATARSGGSDDAVADVTVTVTADKTSYRRGEAIALELVLRNGLTEPVTLSFNTGQRYDFAIQSDDGREVWRWSRERGFIQMIGEERLGPGRSLEFSETVPADFEPGSYTVIGTITSTRRRLRATTTIRVE